MNQTQSIPISILHYDKNESLFKEKASLEDCRLFKDKQGTTWINIDGVTDINLLRSIGEVFGLHELTVQDIANTEHRVKYEDFGHYLVVIMKMLEFRVKDKSIYAEQLSIVFGSNFVITFQEKPGDFFGPLRDEIKIADSVVRKMGSDYLACRIMDTVVDYYFNTVEKFGDEIEDKEDELVANPTRETLGSIQGIKKNMMQLRQYVWPVREILSDLSKKDSALIKIDTLAYFRDVYDRLFEVMDLIETTREMVGGLIDIYLSSMSNKTNEVMKVLTIVATIFIPLTFIVGLYGMNFKFMPELESPWGYPIVVTGMVLIAAGMLMYFHRRKWI
jgi:magnesium transporter